jgi:hypothetical protein
MFEAGATCFPNDDGLLEAAELFGKQYCDRKRLKGFERPTYFADLVARARLS